MCIIYEYFYIKNVYKSLIIVDINKLYTLNFRI